MLSVLDRDRLREALAPYRAANGSGCRVIVSYRNGAGSADLLLAEDWRVRAEEALVEELRRQPRVVEAAYCYAG